MRRLGLVVALLGCVIAGNAMAAATPAGKAVGVDPAATDVVANASKTLVVGADVAMGDKIVTGAGGQVQLVFDDQTHLVVGPNSALVIQSYLLRNDKSVSKFAVNALGGTFRFITGKSDHDAYTINTPTGTIGVRGTAFDFTVDDQTHGQTPPNPEAKHHSGPSAGDFLPGTTVVLFRGAVILCNLAGKCVVLDNRCEAGEILTPDTTKFGRFQATEEEQLRARFRYIQSQKPLLPDFRIDESRLCFVDTNGAGGLSTEVHDGGAGPGFFRACQVNCFSRGP